MRKTEELNKVDSRRMWKAVSRAANRELKRQGLNNIKIITGSLQKTPHQLICQLWVSFIEK